MSTLTIIETIDANLILSHLHSSSQYFISVSICNYFDCGPSSLAIDFKTSSSSILQVPVKPTSIQPTSIRAKIYYKMSNEIGLKILYPPEIIENLIITYKIQNTSLMNQFNITPPLLNIRLTNLSCGNSYEIMIYAKNQVGLSLTEYLITETEGSGRILTPKKIVLTDLIFLVPSLIEPKDLFETISSNSIILNMEKWMIDECPILSYEIELFPIKNSSERNFNRYISSENRIQIANLQSNQDYQLNIKIHSEAGEKLERISFRTIDNKHRIKIKHQQIIFLMIFIASFLFTFVFILILMKILKKTGLYKKEENDLSYIRNLELFGRRLKPVVHRSYQKTWVKTKSDFTIENYIKKNRSDSFSSGIKD
jgi:hypothetical protein